MAHVNWMVYVDGNRHLVELEHGYLSGRRVITVDGEIVINTKVWWIDFGSIHAIPIGSKAGFVIVKTNGLTFRYDLVIDGMSQTTHEKVNVDDPTYQPGWGKRPPRWLGGHLSPLEEAVLGIGIGTAGLGAMVLMLPHHLFRALGLILLAIGVSACFVRRKSMLAATAAAILLAMVVAVLTYPPPWKLMLLPSVVVFRAVSLYRQDLSPTRPE